MYPFPGPIPARFDTPEEYRDYFISLLNYELFMQEKSKSSEVYRSYYTIVLGQTLLAGQGKGDIDEAERENKLKNASLRLKVCIKGYFNFEIDDMILVDIPEWKGMHKYGGFARITRSYISQQIYKGERNV